MKTRITKVILFSAAFAMQSSFGQTSSQLYKSFSLGLICGEYGYDAGIGIEFGTPSMFNNHLSFRVRGTENWLESYKSQFDKWVKYETLTVSFAYNRLLSERARGYIELGPHYVFPDKQFSNEKPRQGLSSSIGVELFVFTRTHLNVCYYFSGGYAAVRAYADKLENKPRYANGFVFNNGFRFYF